MLQFSSSTGYEQDDLSSANHLRSRYCNFHYASKSTVKCYYFSTPDGGFMLPLALIRNKTDQPLSSRHLLVHIGGGPGQGNMTSATEIEYWVKWLEDSGAEFDLLIFDPRGTGQGKGVWKCEAFDKKMKYVLSQPLQVDEEMSLLNRELEPCFEQLAEYVHTLQKGKNQVNNGLSAFSTQQQAGDVNAMVRALGYQNAHLWGVSYGTRVALAAAKDNNIKSLILDSPYPFERGLFSDWPILYERIFRLHDNLFQKIMPDSEFSYQELYQKLSVELKKHPRKFNVVDWQTSEVIPFVLTADRLLELSFSVLYNEQMYQLFYLGLATLALDGNVDQNFDMVIEDFVINIFDEGFNSMVYFATECVDNAPQAYKQVEDALSKASSQVADYFQTSWQYDACNLYDFKAQYHVQDIPYTDKPTLIFSGSHDPITPSSWGQELAQHFSNAKHVVINNAGHGVLFRHSCGDNMMNRFIHTKNLATFDIACEEQRLWQ